mmetsp:Transcript_13558/g.24309  ORF Transcript_13558/g.24309 Transcript_13558/m.24309 type:complete len:84 (+) Transcript_13558:89-340(+)
MLKSLVVLVKSVLDRAVDILRLLRFVLVEVSKRSSLSHVYSIMEWFTHTIRNDLNNIIYPFINELIFSFSFKSCFILFQKINF